MGTWTTADFQRPRGGRSVPSTSQTPEHSRPHYGIDLDGCVYYFDVAMRRILNELGDYGLEEDSRYYSWLKDQVSPEHWEAAWRDQRLYQLGPPYPGAVPALKQLSTLGDVTIITHRPEPHVDATRTWLVEHSVAHDELIVVPPGERKSACAVVRPCDLYVDDRVECVEDYLTRTNATVMVPRRPWNEQLWAAPRPWLIPFDEWEEVVEWAINNRTY